MMEISMCTALACVGTNVLKRTFLRVCNRSQFESSKGM